VLSRTPQAGHSAALPSAAARAVREKARRERLNDMCAFIAFLHDSDSDRVGFCVHWLSG